VGKVIASSSASLYGLAEEFPTTERHHPWNNDTFYGWAKVMNEGMLKSFRAMQGLDYVALRYFNVYGPRMDIHGLYTEVLIRWMQRIAAGQPPLIFGDGAQTMDFVFTTDIAHANLLAAASGVTEGVYNIASEQETSLRGLAEALLRTMGSDLAIEFGPARQVNGVTRRLASTAAARHDLGWTATIGLDEGLHRLVDWWLVERETDSELSGVV
jgi:UDP-glucose 4-epimerase